MNYPRIISAIRSAKWAMLPSTMQAMRDALAAHINGKLAASDIPGRRRAYDEGQSSGFMRKPFSMVAPGIACVELCGIIGKNLSSLEMDCGGCDIGQVESDLRLALAAPGVSSVILHIESPGGAVPGVGEFAAKIESLSAAAGKLVWAFVDGRCCSAAYWIACGCYGIIGTTSSDVGSIGVFMACVDESEAWAKEGYKLVLIKAGAFKGAGIPGSEISPEQITIWQADVDAIYATFSGFVSARRPAVTSDSMQGQVFFGARAQTAGLVDEMVPDLEAMIAKISLAQPHN
jgi:signal peptide peptidase SppA